MPITITLDSVLKDKGITGKELAERVGISETQMSLFRSGKVKGIRFSTLDRMCEELGCTPGDLLGHVGKIEGGY